MLWKRAFLEISIFGFRFLISGNDGAEILRTAFDHSFHLLLVAGRFRNVLASTRSKKLLKQLLEVAGGVAHLA
jgi:hypothetical protein